VIFTLGTQPTEGAWTVFGGVTGRYFVHTTVLHLLYSRLKRGLLG